MKLKLISFAICPFVQRSVIVLKQKKVDFEIEYIDLKNKPDWFLEISPLGRVPVLVVDEKDVIFESAIISEFVDEVTQPVLALTDAVAKAKERAWIAYASEMQPLQYQTLIATDEEGFSEKVNALIVGLMRLKEVAKAPFYRGTEFSLVDAAYAPIFMRMAMMPEVDAQFRAQAKERDAEHLVTWYDHLLAQDYVKNSVIDNFTQETETFFADKDSYYFARKAKAA